MASKSTNDDRWVATRLGALEPAAGWRPDPAAALVRVRERDRVYRKRRTRWMWISGAAAVAFLFVMATPARCDAANSNSCGQPLAGRLWSAVFSKPEEARPVPQRPSTPAPAVAPPPGLVAESHQQSQPGRKAPAAPARLLTDYKTFGAFDAPITCEIYSDYECPACASLYLNFMPQFIAQFVQTGKVRIVHRDVTFHAHSKLATRYVNAAGMLGQYDVAVNRLFQTQASWSADGNIDAQLTQVLAPDVMQKVRALVENDARLDQTVAADMAMANTDGIRRTPTLVFVSQGKRQPLDSIPDFGLLKTYIDELLRK